MPLYRSELEPEAHWRPRLHYALLLVETVASAAQHRERRGEEEVEEKLRGMTHKYVVKTTNGHGGQHLISSEQVPQTNAPGQKGKTPP